METLFDVVTEVAEDVVDAVADGIIGVLDGAQEFLATNAPYWVTAILNVPLGIIKGNIDWLRDWTKVTINNLRTVGRFLGALLALDISGMLRALVDLVIGLGELIALGIRLITLAPFIAGVAGYYERDRDRNFIRELILSEFDSARAAEILERLGWGSTHFGLRLPVDVRMLAADTDSFSLDDMHRRRELDLYTMAGLLSVDSFRFGHERTRVTHVHPDGRDNWLRPVTRWDISHYLEGASDAPRLRAYAMTNWAAGQGMRFAKEHYRTLCVDLRFQPSEWFARFQTFPMQECLTEDEFLFYSNDDRDLDRRASHDGALWFAEKTDQNGSEKMDHKALAIGVFAFRRRGLNGRAYGRHLKRSIDPSSPCGPGDTTDGCITDILRRSDDHSNRPSTLPDDTPTGSGCTWRDTYPPYFSKVVLAHEIGHWFGLCHAGHEGVQHIMFSRVEHDPLSWDSWRLWLHGGPTFNKQDLEHTWRFIVERMPHVL